ncbi:MAG TPA: hypothetical protein VGG10_20925 [Rhizomicrobium sp.]
MRKYRVAAAMRHHLTRTAASGSHGVAGAVSDHSPDAVFGEIGLILGSTLGLVTLVQFALVAFHVS